MKLAVYATVELFLHDLSLSYIHPFKNAATALQHLSVCALTTLDYPALQVSELHDTCEALTLDKEQLAFEKEELQAWLNPCPAKVAEV